MLKVVQKPHISNYIELWWDNENDPTWSHAPSDEILAEVSNWVETNNLGRRTAYNGWQLRSGAASAAFVLRWSPP